MKNRLAILLLILVQNVFLLNAQNISVALRSNLTFPIFENAEDIHPNWTNKPKVNSEFVLSTYLTFEKVELFTGVGIASLNYTIDIKTPNAFDPSDPAFKDKEKTGLMFLVIPVGFNYFINDHWFVPASITFYSKQHDQNDVDIYEGFFYSIQTGVGYQVSLSSIINCKLEPNISYFISDTSPFNGDNIDLLFGLRTSFSFNLGKKL